MSTAVQQLENGQFEVLINESLGQDENLGIRTVCESAEEVKKQVEWLFKEVVVPRKKQYQHEVIAYQMEMQSAALELENNAKKENK